MKQEREILKELIDKEILILQKTVEYIQYSCIKVSKINLSGQISPADAEVIDSFSSRFLRTYEVLCNQLLRSVLNYQGELKNTYLDNLNKSEQLGMIPSADELNEIRKLRNQVAHGYLEEEWLKIVRKLLKGTPILVNHCRQIIGYIGQKLQ